MAQHAVPAGASADAGPAPAASADQTVALRQAFEYFNRASAELTQAYEALQRRVESLTVELSVANGELRRQYREKEALSDRLGALLNALPAGVVVLDALGRINEANPAAVAMLGDGLLGRNWASEVEPRLVCDPGSDERLLPSREGTLRLTLAESPAVAGGRILLLHDVTAAWELKARLERNQRLAAMGELAASLAHQLRTPLSTALLYCGNLARPDLAPEDRNRFAERVSEQLKRLERLISDVLLFARGETIGREAIGVAELVGEAVQEVEALRCRRAALLRVDGDGGGFCVVGARKPLTAALVSLLENALQASEPGGEVCISSERVGRLAAIRVSDRGSGIAPEHLARVFEPFFTTRGQGTGLGLAIALGVVRAHGGTIEARSVLGAGSEFEMRLPAGAREEIVQENQRQDS